MNKSILSHQRIENSLAKEWIVFIHGAGGSTATWKYQLEAFKPFYNLLLIDLRDHGLSKHIEPDADRYDFDLITQDIKTTLDENKVDRAHFITLSFGSVIMQDLSIKYPDMVASAIFAGGIFKANAFIKSFVQLARIFNFFLPYKLMYSIFSYLLMPFKKHQKSRKIYKRQAKKLKPEEYLKWVGLYAEFFRLLNRFYQQNINFPSLVIMGKEDYIFLKSAKGFSNRHKSVILREISGAGHICNIDQPAIFNELALYFVHQHKYAQDVNLPAFHTQ